MLLLLLLGPLPSSQRASHPLQLSAQASPRFSAPSVLSCLSQLGPPGGALSLLKLTMFWDTVHCQAVGTNNLSLFLGFGGACQLVGHPCQSSEALCPFILIQGPFLQPPSYTRISLSKIPLHRVSGAESKGTPKIPLININNILIIIINAKIHNEQNIKILSQDRISITDFFLWPQASIWLSPALMGFTPCQLIKDVAFCICLSPAASPVVSPLDPALAYFPS